MGELYFSVPQMAYSMPAIATLVVGVVLLCVRRRRLAPRAWTLGVAGLAVLLAGALADLVYVALLPQLIGGGGLREAKALLAATGLLFLTLHVVGMSLIIAALLATGGPKQPWDQPAPEPRPELG
ncbi:hypothetical protein Daura_35435 [Dactylosporangium aurantiacum]|uniref:Uncharacterized protein n=1 Tax=Dactylosporangium aurantiacum TaxID=35754 RepID=A0A9Q9MEY1_9ACTN|nr:hypothetical protein [Dactylosporangium aurantiacum]MDG6103533.1 hypothetical protein [Dactylosporangium aurantiacum]UWZ51970.1 hypothetical protein Daura_35435 [Dactylosporangium aurantiacum]